ncbi:MAG: helix-turn-helix domain-containing protein, partial [Bacteroidota bacterium]
MTADIFESFKPQHPTIARYVDYYYLDFKPHNQVAEFECFPHYNNTISIYRSHQRWPNGDMVYTEGAGFFQIFTPIREKVLFVRQVGMVHRLVIVFHPLGIQQFFKDLDFSGYISDFSFFNDTELKRLFHTDDTTLLIQLLDRYLLERYLNIKDSIVSTAINQIFDFCPYLQVEELAKQSEISRRHLNRLFNKELGLSPKKFQEIVLFRMLMEKKLFSNTDDNFTALAYSLNFSDQAHMNKSF